MESIVCFGVGIDGHTFLKITEEKVRIECLLDNMQQGKLIRNISAHIEIAKFMNQISEKREHL